MELECPHCGGRVWLEKGLEDVRCGIFRHAVWKTTMQPIPPHSDKNFCERVLRENLVHGCALPFRVLMNNEKNTVVVEKCDYL
jgi:hypothetical protein